MLRALAAQGKAVLISSHILTELAEICDSCAILEQGKLLAVGPVADLVARSTGKGAFVELTLRLAGEGGAHADASARAERLILEQPGVAKVGVEGAVLRVRLAAPEGVPPAPGWADEAAARLLVALVGASVPVCSFQQRELDLEDAFMSVTQGRIA